MICMNVLLLQGHTKEMIIHINVRRISRKIIFENKSTKIILGLYYYYKEQRKVILHII